MGTQPTGGRRGRGLSGHGKNVTERRARMGTHELYIAEGGTYQDMERMQPTEAHSLPRDHRGRNLSGHGIKVNERGALTLWGPQKERLIRTRKDARLQVALTSCRAQREREVRIWKYVRVARGQ